MVMKIKDYKLKPPHKLFHPYFSPNFNNHKINHTLNNFLINTIKIYKYYLLLIKINTKFLFAVPIQNNSTPSIEITRIIIKDISDNLGSLRLNLKINNIRADGDSKFGKMIENNDRAETIKLGIVTYKRNSFLDNLASEDITLYLNTSPFLNKNG
jgi:hypothetical protein